MFAVETERIDDDTELMDKWGSAEEDIALSFLVSSADAELIEKETIEKWGVAGYDGAISLLMSRKTLKVQKAEIILKKWMQENNENIFRSELSDLNNHLDYLRIRLKFELNDVILSAKLKASSKLMLIFIEEHKDTLLAKYQHLTYKDDFGNIVLKDFDKELGNFCKNFLVKKYEFYNIITEYTYELLHQKYLQHAKNNFFGTNNNEILKIAKKQLDYQFETDLENFSKFLCMEHLHRILLEDDI